MGQAEGFGFVALSIVCFGSNFVVTKKFKSGDGFFFQFVMCTAILLAGLAHFLYLCTNTTDLYGNTTCPPFQPFAMLVRGRPPAEEAG